MVLFIRGLDPHFIGSVSSSCSEALTHKLLMSNLRAMCPYIEKGTARII